MQSSATCLSTPTLRRLLVIVCLGVVVAFIIGTCINFNAWWWKIMLGPTIVCACILLALLIPRLRRVLGVWIRRDAGAQLIAIVPAETDRVIQI